MREGGSGQAGRKGPHRKELKAMPKREVVMRTAKDDR
jgi:hypothetical protein